MGDWSVDISPSIGIDTDTYDIVGDSMKAVEAMLLFYIAELIIGGIILRIMGVHVLS